ncbi:putative acyl--CoA ligase YdaB [Aplysia californica]|uniref:Medium-chain acyl-CoA ligase ACSF2, mitochondrial n=1 Tax=Aplysia californica TaxID=6500 RepID=A0ABM0JAT7_APLCA|nr:putative acyl--CoA ligase YdaB [Aplysia californica]
MGVGQSIEDHYDTLNKRIKRYAECTPNKELFIFRDGDKREAITARDWLELSGRFSAKLKRQGFLHNDVIANTLPNSPERLITDTATILAGCVSLNGQILLSDGADFFLSARASRCRAVVVTPDGGSPAWKLLQPYIKKSSSLFAELSCDQAPELTRAILVTRDVEGSIPALMTVLRDDVTPPLVTDVSPDTDAIVMTTSGSTGYSKLVPRTHKEIIDYYKLFIRDLDKRLPNLRPGDKPFFNDRPLAFKLLLEGQVRPAPQGWIAGYPHSTYYSTQPRLLLDFWNGPKEGDEKWKAIEAEGCFGALLLSLDLATVLKQREQENNSSQSKFKLQMMMSQFSSYLTLTADVVSAYGSTEGHVVSSASITGAAVFKSYLNRLDNNHSASEKAFTADGWFKTEDDGYVDDEGNVYVLGRKNDVIMYGAYVLYPTWLEEKIAKHPDVMEACVVPVPDPVKLHEICACVKTDPGSDLTEEELRQFCEKLFVVESESTPSPKYFIIMGSEFPQTASGKTDRQVLKRLASEKFAS